MRRATAFLVPLAIVLLHVALALHFDPLAVIFGGNPITTIDYDMHFEQTVRAIEAYRTAGRLWAWDPHLLAGSISGAIFDADNKLHELFTLALAQLGVPTARAYNFFVLVAHLGLLPAMGVTARLLRLDRAETWVAIFLASMTWWFDSFSHWVWWVGMISYGFAAYACLVPIGLFARFVETRRPIWAALLFVALALLHHLHPYSFFILVVPLTVAYVRVAKSLSRAEHAMVIAAAVGTLVANLWWLRVALRFWHYVLDSGFYLDATLSYLFTDWLGLLKEPSTTGVMAMRSSFRFLALGAAAIEIVRWRREKDERFFSIGVPLGVLLVVAYLGGYSSVLRQVQPYRFVLPATYLAILPASAFLVRAVRAVRATPPERPVFALLGLALFLLVPKVLRDAIYFLPSLVPRPERELAAPPPNFNGPLAFGTIVWPEPFEFKHVPVSPRERDLADFVKKHDDKSGRWLVQYWQIGEFLAWATDAEILGGFRELNLAHSDANFFRRFPDGNPPDPADVDRYVAQYNVRWVVLSGPAPALERRTDLFEPVGEIGGARIWRTRKPGSWFEGQGSGDVHASLDRIAVRGSSRGSLVLRYHFLETFVCRPNCRVRRVDVPGDRVGFVGVDDAPTDFEIVNPGRRARR